MPVTAARRATLNAHDEWVQSLRLNEPAETVTMRSLAYRVALARQLTDDTSPPCHDPAPHHPVHFRSGEVLMDWQADAFQSQLTEMQDDLAPFEEPGPFDDRVTHWGRRTTEYLFGTHLMQRTYPVLVNQPAYRYWELIDEANPGHDFDR